MTRGQRPGSRLRNLGLALALGAGAALASVALVQARHNDELVVGDRVATAVAELREDRVHVAPDGRAMLDEKAEERLEAAAADVDPPAYVVVWGSTLQGGYQGVGHVIDQLAQELGEDGAYLVWEPGGQGWHATAEGYYLATGDRPAEWLELVGDPETRITEWLSLVDDSEVVALDSDDWGGLGGGLVLGTLLAGGGYLALMLLVNVLRLVAGRSFLAPGTLWPGLARDPSPSRRAQERG